MLDLNEKDNERSRPHRRVGRLEERGISRRTGRKLKMNDLHGQGRTERVRMNPGVPDALYP